MGFVLGADLEGSLGTGGPSSRRDVTKQPRVSAKRATLGIREYPHEPCKGSTKRLASFPSATPISHVAFNMGLGSRLFDDLAQADVNSALICGTLTGFLEFGRLSANPALTRLGLCGRGPRQGANVSSPG